MPLLWKGEGVGNYWISGDEPSVTLRKGEIPRAFICKSCRTSYMALVYFSFTKWMISNDSLYCYNLFILSQYVIFVWWKMPFCPKLKRILFGVGSISALCRFFTIYQFFGLARFYKTEGMEFPLRCSQPEWKEPFHSYFYVTAESGAWIHRRWSLKTKQTESHWRRQFGTWIFNHAYEIFFLEINLTPAHRGSYILKFDACLSSAEGLRLRHHFIPVSTEELLFNFKHHFYRVGNLE